MPKSSKRSRSKGNSLPPTKQFDFTMVDDDFEELQRGSPRRIERRYEEMCEALQRLDQRKEPSQQLNH